MKQDLLLRKFAQDRSQKIQPVLSLQPEQKLRQGHPENYFNCPICPCSPLFSAVGGERRECKERAGASCISASRDHNQLSKVRRTDEGRLQHMGSQLACFLFLEDKANFSHLPNFAFPSKHLRVAVNFLSGAGAVEILLKYYFFQCVTF